MRTISQDDVTTICRKWSYYVGMYDGMKCASVISKIAMETGHSFNGVRDILVNKNKIKGAPGRKSILTLLNENIIEI